MSLIGETQFFMTGTDSPVSMLSLTIQEPVKRTMSHGIRLLSGTTTTSPGTRSLLETYCKLELLLTSMEHSKAAIFLMLLIFVTVSYKFSIMLEIEMTKIQKAYFS